jgi:hypothetical protein
MMDTVAELDERIESLTAEAQRKAAQIRKLAAEAVDRPGALKERAELREWVDSVPGQVGELARRRFMARLAELRAERDELAPQYAEASDKADAGRAAVAQLVKEKRAAAANYARQQELQGEIYRIGRQAEADLAAAENLRFKLEAVYSQAAQMGVYLDQGRLQYKYQLQGVSLASADSPALAEQAAVKFARQAEEQARRELRGVL